MFLWNEAHQKSFDCLKHALTHAPILQLPYFKRPFFLVVTDASGKGIGAVLMKIIILLHMRVESSNQVN